MKQKRDPRFLILRTLRDFPFLSEPQLRWLWSWTKHVTQRHLWEVHHQGLVRRYPLFVESQPTAQWLYTLTAKGLQTLMQRDALALREYQSKYSYSISRLRWLASVLERVYHARQVLFGLDTHSANWGIVRWNSETEARYRLEKGWRCVSFHCSAVFENRAKDRWLPVAIVWDTGEVPVQAERGWWRNFFKAQYDCADAYSSQAQFPILCYVAADAARLDEVWRLLRDVTLETQIAIPRVCLTSRAQLKHAEPAGASNVAAWYDPYDGVWVSDPLAELEGLLANPGRFWHPRPFRKSYASTQVEIEPARPAANIIATSDNLAALALALRPVERKLLNTIGSHPLLTANELAFVLTNKPARVWSGLARLRQWRLIQAHDCRGTRPIAQRARKTYAYTINELGLASLAAMAGLGARPQRIAMAHGWEKGVEPLIRHFMHTRISNQAHIQLLRYARTRGHQLTWLSEQEARLYLKVREQKWSGPFQSISVSTRYDRRLSEREEENAGEYETIHTGGYSNRREFHRALGNFGGNLVKFLPDGRGIYQVGKEKWHVGLEIDLTRANHQKIRAKLSYYFWFRRIVEDAWNLRILIVTHHWERALNLYWLIWGDAADMVSFGWRAEWRIKNQKGKELAEIVERYKPKEVMEQVMPVYITTVEELERHGIDQPIWLRVQEEMGENDQVNRIFSISWGKTIVGNASATVCRGRVLNRPYM